MSSLVLEPRIPSLFSLWPLQKICTECPKLQIRHIPYYPTVIPMSVGYQPSSMVPISFPQPLGLQSFHIAFIDFCIHLDIHPSLRIFVIHLRLCACLLTMDSGQGATAFKSAQACPMIRACQSLHFTYVLKPVKCFSTMKAVIPCWGCLLTENIVRFCKFVCRSVVWR